MPDDPEAVTVGLDVPVVAHVPIALRYVYRASSSWLGRLLVVSLGPSWPARR